jgi:transcriptional regulator with XRE-family HTH domain
MDGTWTATCRCSDRVKRGELLSVADVAYRVRHFRGVAGLTQEALARNSKLTSKFVSQIENAHVNPSIGVLARLVQDGLAMSLGTFFAAEIAGDRRDDLSRLLDLFANQPPDVRKRALRVLNALCEDGADLKKPRRRR